MKDKRNKIPMVRKCEYCEEVFRKNSPPEIYCSMICRLFDSCGRKDCECWIWKKGKDYDGYGLMSVKNKTQKAHRVSYETFIGWIPNEVIVCHKCDNPSCINPLHLFTGSPQQNTDDMFKKGRERVIGEKNVKSILTEDEIGEILKQFNLGFRISEISLKFGLSWEHVSAIVKRKIWKHVNPKP